MPFTNYHNCVVHWLFDIVSKRSSDIREILSCGSIRAEDLGYLAVLGSGNCGKVYKSVKCTLLCRHNTGAYVMHVMFVMYCASMLEMGIEPEPN